MPIAATDVCIGLRVALRLSEVDESLFQQHSHLWPADDVVEGTVLDVRGDSTWTFAVVQTSFGSVTVRSDRLSRLKTSAPATTSNAQSGRQEAAASSGEHVSSASATAAAADDNVDDAETTVDDGMQYEEDPFAFASDDDEPSASGGSANASPVEWQDWGEVPVDARGTIGRNSAKISQLSYLETASRFKLFKHFLPEDAISGLLDATNASSRLNPGWRTLSFSEFIEFVSILLEMTFYGHRPSKLFWSNSTPTDLLQPNFANIMTYSRFCAIRAAISLAANDEDDPLVGVRRFQNLFNENMARSFSPSWRICVDESMTRWTAEKSCPPWVYIPRKPTPAGMEFKTAACADTMIIFAAELVRDPKKNDYEDKYNKTTALLLRLLRPYSGSGRCVALDSWFCTLEGIAALYQNLGLYGVMMMKKRGRYWPKYICGEALAERTKSLPIGGVIGRAGTFTSKSPNGNNVGTKFFICGQRDLHGSILCVSTWSTTLPDERSRKQYRKLKERSSDGRRQVTSFFRPAVLSFYYTTRHCVDDNNNTRQGRMTSLEDVWQTHDWQKRALAFFLGVIEANAYHAYSYFVLKAQGKQPESLMHFRECLFKEMREAVALAVDVSQPETRSSSRTGARCQLVSIPAFSSWKDGQWRRVLKRQAPQRRCRLCGKQTVYYCSCSPEVSVCKHCFGDHVASKSM